MKKYLTSALAFSVLALAGCNDSLGPGNASEEDREDIVAGLAEAGFFGDDFGDDGVVGHVANYFDGAAAAEPPLRWGRRHRVAVSRPVMIRQFYEAALKELRSAAIAPGGRASHVREARRLKLDADGRLELIPKGHPRARELHLLRSEVDKRLAEESQR